MCMWAGFSSAVIISDWGAYNAVCLLSYILHLQSSRDNIFLPSSRQLLCDDVCLDEKREDQQNCWVWLLYSKCILILAVFTGRQRLLTTRLWLDVFACTLLCYFLYCVFSVVSSFIIVTWWCGPGGIEAWSWPSSSFSAMTLLVGSFDLYKTRY